MNSTRRYLPILAIGLVFFFTSSLAADSQQQTFDSTLRFPNPCNNLLVTVTGTTMIDYHGNSTDGGSHVNVHLQIEASGQDDSGNPYRTNLEGNGQFDDVATSYDVPFHSVWAGQQGASSFTLSGVIRVFVSDAGLASQAVAVDPAVCTN